MRSRPIGLSLGSAQGAHHREDKCLMIGNRVHELLVVPVEMKLLPSRYRGVTQSTAMASSRCVSCMPSCHRDPGGHIPTATMREGKEEIATEDCGAVPTFAVERSAT